MLHHQPSSFPSIHSHILGHGSTPRKANIPTTTNYTHKTTKTTMYMQNHFHLHEPFGILLLQWSFPRIKIDDQESK